MNSTNVFYSTEAVVVTSSQNIAVTKFVSIFEKRHLNLESNELDLDRVTEILMPVRLGVVIICLQILRHHKDL